ncbi:MAG: hypothetical protein AB8F78_10010 [Saprospiraceae bacterium]
MSLAQTTLSFGGLKRTQLSFIAINLDGVELTSHKDTLIWVTSGAPIDTSALFTFRQNLINLPQIQGASFEVKGSSKGNSAHIHWVLKEAQTIAPLFSFGGVRGNVNVLVGINDQHLFGKGQELIAYYQLIQREHNFLIAFKNPSLRNSRFGASGEVRRYAAEEPVYFNSGTAEYLYINQSLALGGSYRVGLRNILNVGASIFREDFALLGVPGEIPEAPINLRVNKLLLKAGHRLDRRNYLSERIAGAEYSSVVEVVLNTTDQPFVIAWHELRHYGLVGKRGNWANRLRIGIATNRESPFAPFVLDSQLNIRGSGNRIDRGSAQVVLNSEYRHLVWKNAGRNFSVQTVVFSDLGTWRAPGGEVAELVNGTTLRHFVGGGLRLISAKAKNAVLRLDYGIDVQDADLRGFVLGFGQYF